MTEGGERGFAKMTQILSPLFEFGLVFLENLKCLVSPGAARGGGRSHKITQVGAGSKINQKSVN